MPKPGKKRSKLDESSDSDSGPEDRTPVKSRKSDASSGSTAKTAPAKAGGAGAGRSGGGGNPAVEGQEPTWELGKMKKVKVREWRNQVFIDIREWYVDRSTMEEKPGKKGISLSAEQYQKFKTIIEEIDAALP
ncbi:hypothetical protein TCAL_14442 [Tigriopus californicus]|uniref:Transcriptional coactivator p15 (PC4) C-terminal domain-containing protein n=1 Tax=Tigriopus californicus TaxID=6832 RepID=A0A553PKK2_TIGCA|nr:RNA polymerase II transcriptional coactivator-like [Tigriopus californicus]TRY78210.1 hypothetical protein TCAL_14442 [Tigriopus californicus]